MAAVCVYCASGTRIDPSYVALAEQVGVELARRGHSLVSGGGQLSMMGAVARGARSGGARTVGVIPRGLLAKEVGDQDADELLVVDDMRTRKGLMDDRSDAFLALPGGLGTLEELFEDRGFVRRPALSALQWATTVTGALDLVEAGLASPVVMQPLAEEVLEAEP
jgi:uncharacterized protein (TIGR00730 family)